MFMSVLIWRMLLLTWVIYLSPQMLHIKFHNATKLLVFLIIIFYTTQVSMKHSGSLFLYSGDNGGAFAKNSYGNL